MSIQLKESLQSLRRIGVIKPLRIRQLERSSSYPIHSFIRGKPHYFPFCTPSFHEMSFILPSTFLRVYTTSTALPSSPSIDDHSILTDQTTKVNKDKQDTSKSQDDPQQQQQVDPEPKEMSTIKHFEQLITTIIKQTHDTPDASIHWNEIVHTFEKSKTMNLQPSPTMYLSTMTAYSHLDNLEKVILTFKEYKQHYRLKSNAYTLYMSAVLNCSISATAFRILRDIKSNPTINSKEKSQCLAQFVPVYCSSNKKSHLQMAIRAAEELTRIVPSLDDWDSEAIPLITQSLWDSYSKLLKLPHAPITPITAETFISTYIEKSSFIIAKTKYQSSKDVLSSQLFTLFNLLCNQPHFVPTTRTCNLILTLIDSNYGEVKSILASMQRLNVKPDSETISILLRLFGSNLSTHQIKKLYQTLRQQDSVDNKVNPSVYKTFIQVFTQDSANLTQAQRVVSDMKESGVELDEGSFVSMAHGFVKEDDIAKGWNWLRKSNCDVLDAYAILMEGWLEGGQWNECIIHYKMLQNQFGSDRVERNRRLVKSLLMAYFSDNNFIASDALLTSGLKIKFTPNTIIRIVNNLINFKTKNGHPLVPGSQIVKSLKMMECNLHVHLDAEGISRVIIGLGDRGDCEDSYRLYRWVREGGHESCRKRCSMSSIYRAMIHSATKNNDIRKLERAWVDMQYRKQYLGACHKGKQPPTLSSYNSLLNGYASRLPYPDITRIKRAFQRMLKMDISPNLVTYNILIKAFVNSNNMDAAVQIFKDMSNKPGIQPDIWTVNTLLKGWINQKDWEQVENFVKELKKMDKIKLDIVSFNLFVQSFLQLDSSSISYAHLLKNQNKWPELERFKSTENYALTSDMIWEIFEKATGYPCSLIQSSAYKKKELSLHSESNSSLCCQLLDLVTENIRYSDEKYAFVELFSESTKADQITYKLFMKAFLNANDYKSASKIYQWMDFRQIIT
ncbi:uncharacterized protein BX663DRAFT_496648 [Cokeromyces recurvatus]|uniref:uncharacterized protein n=1 Tax=Cokeromyces recurvatus TaxID=90255 RepID=UPI00221FC14A|nr:uncharacterized protein BX663DRAFT_496648 [Cokeromyces recurvatus]KAI7906484.1 hypothetical protein BX663DRAFT_496648 [Cokeromyces recurvatus]